MEFIALFYTHSGALRFDKFLRDRGIAVQLMPVPRKLSSNCGIGARLSTIEDISTLISEDIEKVFRVEGREYKLIYSGE
jgi:hypothetical protein